MKSNNKKKKIPYTGLGLIFGGVLGTLLGLILFSDYFILFGGGGVGIGLIVGAIIDAQKVYKSK